MTTMTERDDERATWAAATRTAVYYAVYERAGLIRVVRVTRVDGRQVDSTETGRTFPATRGGEKASYDWLGVVNCRRVVRS